ncbi:MAG: hypothetical protein A2096_11570 [Spirochaetes bacterium GWF1_41_5]|nr:MAG: hypothetical protein A2096_11570 [Spirochaetes bacterium GWF1_41_5]
MIISEIVECCCYKRNIKVLPVLGGHFQIHWGSKHIADFVITKSRQNRNMIYPDLDAWVEYTAACAK